MQTFQQLQFHKTHGYLQTKVHHMYLKMRRYAEHMDSLTEQDYEYSVMDGSVLCAMSVF